MHGLISLIRSDLRRKALWCYGADRPADRLRALMSDGTGAMLTYRMMQWSRRHRLVPLEWAFNKLNVLACGCVIGRGAEFGPGLVLVHSGGIVINGAVRGGTDVTIEHQVTIGAERGRSPQLGSGVFLGAGAKVIGCVSVGDGAKVGANAVVVRDVPPGSTAVGVPARIIVRDGDQAGRDECCGWSRSCPGGES